MTLVTTAQCTQSQSDECRSFDFTAPFSSGETLAVNDKPRITCLEFSVLFVIFQSIEMIIPVVDEALKAVFSFH